MYWLNMTWMTANWIPLLVALVLGYLLGWLLTGMSPARRVRELEARNTELEGKQRKSERELTDLRSDNTKTKASLTAALADVEDARNRSKALDAQVAVLEAAAAPATEEMDVVADAGETEAVAATDAAGEMAATGAADEIAESDENVVADATDAAPQGAALVRQTPAPEQAPDQIAERFTAVARTPEAIAADDAREIALTEAYSRAARLKEDLDQREKQLAARQAELDSTRAELLTSNAARHELDNRLVRAREDVASELAVLASTMIKMKDDALARAEARIAALNAELDGVREDLDTQRSAHSRAAEASATHVDDAADAAGA